MKTCHAYLHLFSLKTAHSQDEMIQTQHANESGRDGRVKALFVFRPVASYEGAGGEERESGEGERETEGDRDRDRHRETETETDRLRFNRLLKDFRQEP